MQKCGPGPRVSKQAFLFFRGILWATLLSSTILSAVLSERAAAATQGTLSFSPSSANFQSVTVGTQKTITVTITNTGTANVVFSKESLYANDFSETGLVLPFSLAPGAHFAVTIKFLPKSAGQFTGRIVLGSNATNSLVSYQMTGTGVASSGGTLSATPSSVSFGSAPLGSSVSQAVQLKNTGTASVTISAESSTNSAFALKGITIPTVLAAGATKNCTLVFTPTVIGTVSGSTKITSNASNSSLTLALNGSGIAASRTLTATPTSVNFGNESVGSANTLSVSLKNTGNSSITVSSVSVTATDVVAGGGISGATLAPGQSATLTVTFAPKQAEAVSGSVKISSNATGSPMSLGVTGAGVAATGHSVTLTWAASTSPNISGYNVYRATGLTGAYSKLTAAPVSGLQFTDTSVVSGETYVYAVTAVNSSGAESSHSTPETVVVP
jgi:Cep192 domain 4/HYDIN/CFA65/VesB-like, Ig-like domain